MFDIWMGEMNLTLLVMILGVVILLPVQLLLCFKARSLTLRLAPVVILALLTLVCIAMCYATPGWDCLSYAVLAIYTGFGVVLCGIGWGIWAIVRAVRRKKA